MFSETGLVPCQLCPRHMFTNESGAPIGGYLKCHSCPTGTYTARLGSNSANQCKLPCSPGHFSLSGLEPCSVCVFFEFALKFTLSGTTMKQVTGNVLILVIPHYEMTVDLNFDSLNFVFAGTSFFILNFLPIIIFSYSKRTMSSKLKSSGFPITLRYN